MMPKGVLAPLLATLVFGDELDMNECLGVCVAVQTTCCAGCLAAMPLPPVFAACLLTCAGAGVACQTSCHSRHRNCFGDGTKVHELENGKWLEKDVVDVEPGSSVLTLIDGQEQATKVVSNRRLQGAIDFVTLDVVDSCGFVRSLTVTGAHNMLVQEGGHLRMLPASELQIGSRVATASCDGRLPNATTAVVEGLERQELKHKNELITADGTVLANGVFVTTICDSKEYSHHPDAQSAIAAWRGAHSARWELLSVDV